MIWKWMLSEESVHHKKNDWNQICAFKPPPPKQKNDIVCLHHFPNTKISLQFFIQPRNLLFNAFTWTTLTTELALFPEIVQNPSGWYPQIIHFNRVFHYFHHPFWGVYQPTPFCWVDTLTCRSHARSHALINHAHTVDGWNPAPVEVGSLSHYLLGFIHPRWCRISAINSRIHGTGIFTIIYLHEWLIFMGSM